MTAARKLDPGPRLIFYNDREVLMLSVVCDESEIESFYFRDLILFFPVEQYGLETQYELVFAFK